MTMPNERANAVLNTANFLKDLLSPIKTPRVPKRIRDQARYLLRHYPCQYDLEKVEEAWDKDSLLQCPFSVKDRKDGYDDK